MTAEYLNQIYIDITTNEIKLEDDKVSSVQVIFRV